MDEQTGNQPDYVYAEVEALCRYLLVPEDDIEKIKNEVVMGETDLFGLVSRYTPYSRNQVKAMSFGLVYGGNMIKELLDKEDPYKAKGYESRQDYINSLAEDRGVDSEAASMIADVLGENEDFDGLVSGLEDFQDLFGEE